MTAAPLGSDEPLTPGIPAAIAAAAPLVTVIGDVILDEWWSGHIERISREAPAPIVELRERVQAPGGAANTAMNARALGARTRLVGLVGADAAGDALLRLLDAAGVDTTGVVRAAGVRTTTKTRIVGDDQVVVRVDDQQEGPVDPDVLAAVAAAAVTATAGADAEIVCDYGSGSLHGVVRDVLLARPVRPRVCVVDAHEPALWAGFRPDVITPNAEEAGRLLGFALGRDADRAAVVAEHADRLLAVSGAASAVVTLDRDGAMLLGAGGPARTHARPALERQANGAGDTFVAALTVGRAAGLPLAASTRLAQFAADVVVHQVGTSICTTAALSERIAPRDGVALGAEELALRIAEERARGRRIVFTNGCFDVLHRGHTTYLRQAKTLGDVLVVALNGDDSVRRLKGPGRPVNIESDRATVLAELGCVDYVTVFATDTPIPLLRALEPEVYAKGGDYSPEMLEETDVVRGYGGEVRILDYVADHSTTALVDRIRASSPVEGDAVRRADES